jgi:mediator of RNA polymerase II transcription subunit 13
LFDTTLLQYRPLVHCHLEVSLLADRLTIHPLLRLTPYVLFPSPSPSLPASGTPITLLPHGVPAFFLAGYTGPTEGLDEQFREALKGLGAGDWEGSDYEKVKDDMIVDAFEKPRHAERDKNSRYVLAWINVQNKQGEDKGMHLVWPSRLCLGYDAGMRREMLQQTPELPTSLQTSVLIDRLTIGQGSASDFDLRFRHAPAMVFSTSRGMFQRPNIRSESIAIGERGIEGLALEVGGYVDAVAKERERERDRIRKEREMSSSSPTKTGTGRTAVDADGSPGAEDSKDQGLTNGSNIGTGLQNDGALELNFRSEAPAAMIEMKQTISSQNVPSSAPPNPLEEVPISGEKESPPAPEIPAPLYEDESPASETPPAQTEQISMQSGFNADPFTNVDAWSQSNDNDDITGMGMGFNAGFGMNLNIGSSGSNGDEYNRAVTMDFDDPFTEDDFNFFDRPSTVKVQDPLPLQTRAISSTIATAATFDSEMASPFFSDSDQIPWPGPPAAPTADSSPWGSGAFGERKYLNGHAHDLGFPAAELPSATPLGTPLALAPSAPTTPNVRLSHDFDCGGTNDQRAATFDPIPFARSHRTADGKYQTGKFALPSPPDEEDRTEPLFSSPPRIYGWKKRYDAATDPRIAMVEKLKRKMAAQGMRDSKMSPQGDREYEEWEHDSQAVCDGKADESDEDVDDDDPLRNNSRPTSPLPAYLPLGPQLLQTRFHHSLLLPLCSPLRPFDTGIAPSNIESVAPPINVPTPVSPAAKIGTASEKSKSLETAAYMVAKEVVENSLWGRAWPSNSPVCNLDGEIWQEDVKAAQEFISSIGYAEGPIDLGTAFDLGRRLKHSFSTLTISQRS